jgi:hypothetical protein
VIVPEIRCRLHYSTKLDRLIGGDFVRDLGGRSVKSFLMPMERAEQLAADTKELAKSYEHLFPDKPVPFPQVLAVLTVPAFPVEVDGREQMVPVDNLFQLDQLSGAPEAFKSLAQTVMVPPDISTVVDHMPSSPPACANFARQLFHVIRFGHRSSFTFSRNSGSNLRPESTTPVGQLNDLYFLTRMPAAATPDELRKYQRNDLLNAIATLMNIAAAAGVPLQEVFAEAAKGYAETVTAPLALSVIEAAHNLGDRSVSSQSASEIAVALADAMLNTDPRTEIKR